MERQEFINVGVILYCQSLRFLETQFSLDKERLHTFACDLEPEEIEKNLDAFKQICRGGADGGSIGKLPQSARFRWLTATRSTIIQTSPVHLGLSTDPQETLEKLFKQMVC